MLTRREFASSLALGAAGLMVPRHLLALPSRTLVPRDAPYTLSNGETLADVEHQTSGSWDYGTTGSRGIIEGTDISGFTLRNVGVSSTLSKPGNRGTAGQRSLRGISLRNCHDFVLENVFAHRLPFYGIYLENCSNWTIREPRTTLCRTGLKIFGEIDSFLIDGLVHTHGWAPDDDVTQNYRSYLDPNLMMGRNAISLGGTTSTVTNGLITRCLNRGETDGIKITNGSNVIVRQCSVATMGIVGDKGLVALDNCVLDKRLARTLFAEEANSLQLTLGARVNLVRTKFYGGGRNGHAVQLADGSRVEYVHQNEFSGYTGTRGGIPAASLDIHPTNHPVTGAPNYAPANWHTDSVIAADTPDYSSRSEWTPNGIVVAS